MPRISEFYGIVIAMYYSEHGVAHFHAIYAGQEASVEVETLGVLAGSLPERALRLVREWGELHRTELKQKLGARTGRPAPQSDSAAWLASTQCRSSCT